MPFDFLQKDATSLLIQPGLSVTATWSGGTLTGVRSLMKRQDAATLAGDQLSYDFSLMVPASQFSGTSRPQPLRDILTIDGRQHLVMALDTDVAGNIRIHLGSRYG